jgi:hypothetical protein
MDQIQGRIQYYVSQEGLRDRELLARSKAAFKEMIGQVRDISRRVKMEEVKEVADFILENLCLRIIEQQGADIIYTKTYGSEHRIAGYEPTLPVVFCVEKIGIFAPEISKSNSFANYFRTSLVSGEADIGSFIGLRDPKLFTPFFQAINLFHEAKHARDHRVNPNYARLTHEEKELPAHLVEIFIMLHYGGRKLLRLASKYAERITKKHGSVISVSSDIVHGYIARYDKDLDEIFGKAASQMEEKLRMDRFMFGFVCNPCLEEIKKMIRF